MPNLRKEKNFPAIERIAIPNKCESARYTYDLLISLKKIAALRKEAQLMRLIDAAAEEAKTLSKNS